MRHGKKINHLGRDVQHRHALMSNMASSLILHKRIYTTVAKAKALRKYVEPLLTRSKTDSTHSRRIVFGYLQNKFALKELFGEVSNKIADRPGGYTRIVRTGFRPGDNAETCLMELVDFNMIYQPRGEKQQNASRRTRRGRGRASGAATETTFEASTSANLDVPPSTEMVADEITMASDSISDHHAEEQPEAEQQATAAAEATEPTNASVEATPEEGHEPTQEDEQA